jgi:alkaline phosphatase D
MTVRIPLSRRQFLATAAASTAMSAVVPKPYLSRAADRPVITHGIQSGDVSLDSAVIWARADRPARMLAEVATTDSFKTIHRAVFVDALPETDFTANALIDGLPAGQDIFYRIRFQDLASPTIVGEPMTGRFRTAPSDQRSISFVWSGDTAGQGWGIDEARGGMRTYATMLRNRPDFFIHNGDNIYADGPILAEQKMPNGEIWKNVVLEEKAKPAETLVEFRANYKYNLLDRNVLAFNAEVPIFSQWDDHEVTNNWWPGEPLTRAEHQRKKYVEKNALLLAARASRAFHEYMPLRFTQTEPGRVYRKISYGPLLDVFMLDMRSYRGPNGEGQEESYGPAAYFLGPAQVAWLKRELLNSQATWKVIAADMPIGLVVVYDTDRKWGVEAIAQGDGPPRGRELEIADILSFIKTDARAQHALAHRRRALHRRALLRSQQGGVPGLRAVLGIRVGPDPRRKLPAKPNGQHVRTAARLREGAERTEPAAQRRLAIFRSRRDRRDDASHDRDAQGLGRSRAVVDHARAEAGVTAP